MDASFQSREKYSQETYPIFNPVSQSSELSYLSDNQGNTLKYHPKDFLYNGQGIGLISMKVIQENEHWLLEEIEELFLKKYQIVFLHFLPVVPNDKKAKLADYLQFKDARSLYLKNSERNELFWQKIANYLKKSGLKVVHNK
jgi:hypothetical protein